MHYGSTSESAESFRSDVSSHPIHDLAIGQKSRDVSRAAFDRCFAALALLILLPIFLGVMLAILVVDGRPFFFGHARIGRNGRTFRCLKFRTMVRDAEDRLDAVLAADPAARSEWEATRKLACDPRVLPFGAVLRKLSIDELPQFWNVLMGDMALVGPRPITHDELTQYGAGGAAAYMSVRPGVTGLWQVSGRNDLDFEDRVRLDMTYVAGRSFKGDMQIMMRTPLVVLRGSGAC